MEFEVNKGRKPQLAQHASIPSYDLTTQVSEISTVL